MKKQIVLTILLTIVLAAILHASSIITYVTEQETLETYQKSYIAHHYWVVKTVSSLVFVICLYHLWLKEVWSDLKRTIDLH